MRHPFVFLLLLASLAACQSVRPAPAPPPAAEAPGRGPVGASIETLGAG